MFISLTATTPSFLGMYTPFNLFHSTLLTPFLTSYKLHLQAPGFASQSGGNLATMWKLATPAGCQFQDPVFLAIKNRKNVAY
jgi:hypothetical protein